MQQAVCCSLSAATSHRSLPLTRPKPAYTHVHNQLHHRVATFAAPAEASTGNRDVQSQPAQETRQPKVVEWSSISAELNENALSAYLYDEDDDDDYNDEIDYTSAIQGAWNDEAIAEATRKQEEKAEEVVSPVASSQEGSNPAAAAASPYSAEGGFRQISPEDLHHLVQIHAADPEGHMMAVIDVRPEEEYLAGHVPGALSVPLARLSDTIRSSGLHNCKDIPIAVIGDAASMYPGIPGTTSAQANVRLRKVIGFTNVVSLKGGMPAWIAAGLPVREGRT